MSGDRFTVEIRSYRSDVGVQVELCNDQNSCVLNVQGSNLFFCSHEGSFVFNIPRKEWSKYINYEATRITHAPSSWKESFWQVVDACVEAQKIKSVKPLSRLEDSHIW